MAGKYLDIDDFSVHIKKETLEELKELKAKSDEYTKKVKDLTSGIVEEIKEITNETTPFGDYNFIVKGGFYSTEFDIEKFKQDHPTLYLEYLKPSYSKVSYSLTKATKEKK